MNFARNTICALALTVFIAISATSWAEGNARVGDFSLLDASGKHHQLSYYGDQKAIVIAAHQIGNAGTNVSAALAQSHSRFADQGVQFFMLNPSTQNVRDAIVEQAHAQGHGIPVLIDETQLVAESLGLKRYGDVLVINAKTMQTTYRGAMDAQNVEHFNAALLATINGVDAGAHVTAQSGTEIAYASKVAHAEQPVSYSRDIAPMLEKNCVQCHHEGGIGPWAMTNHAMVQGWSAMMREVVMARRMPPGQIDAHISKPVTNAAGLSSQDMQKLIHWIDAGAVKDGDADPLAELTFSDQKFSLGEPDLVYKVAAQAIPATGIIDYRFVPVQLNLDRDVWVRAMEFIPGDKQVLHHVIAFVSSPADKSVRGRETGAAQGESVGGFAPGRQPDEFRDNSGRLLRKGSNLLLQMHYTTSGREAVDATEIGIYLYDEPPTYVMSGGVSGQRRFLVPPHAKEHKLEGEQLIERDAYLYDLMPHMHYRGKYMSYSLIYPDGKEELVLSVPKYDFNWQFNYRLAEPLFMPAGSRLVARGAMDNSARNPSNPDPTKPVHFGLQTKHEMFFGFTNIRYVGDTPEKLVGTKKVSAPVTGGSE